ncbi:hypothetical protein QQF64_002036 [Cirrhinus molitorella]|uniref:Uncharacterized protein n=1 Tax=Cirrhinus molitorella TaxID=172907 RepID=A0ABR3MP19_9TELE
MMDFISQTTELSQLSCGWDTHSNKPSCPSDVLLHLFACYKSSPRVLAGLGCQIPRCDRRARSCLTHSCSEYECLCTSSSRRTGIAEQLSDRRHVASERLFFSTERGKAFLQPAVAIDAMITVNYRTVLKGEP